MCVFECFRRILKMTYIYFTPFPALMTFVQGSFSSRVRNGLRRAYSMDFLFRARRLLTITILLSFMVIFSCRLILDLREAVAPAEDSAEFNTGILFVLRSQDHSTNAIAPSVYGATVLWASDAIQGGSLLERVEEV